MTTLGTLFYTWTKGRFVGTDQAGNRYYVEKTNPKDRRAKRWVIYRGAAEASKVPAEWHAWLHYTADAPLAEAAPPAWRRPHEPNMTGTPKSYLPPGHDLRGGQRQRAAGDYEAWQP